MSTDPVAPDPSAPTGARPVFVELHGSRARRVGHHEWMERRLFEMLGAWSATTPEAPVAVLFGELSRRHGWHASLFHDRLPELASVDADALVVPPGPATASLMDEIVEDPGPGRTIEHLVAVHRVLLPMVIAGHRAELAASSVVADASLARWLRIIIEDDVEECRRAEELLQGLLTDESTVTRAAETQAHFESVALATRALSR